MGYFFFLNNKNDIDITVLSYHGLIHIRGELSFEIQDNQRNNHWYMQQRVHRFNMNRPSYRYGQQSTTEMHIVGQRMCYISILRRSSQTNFYISFGDCLILSWLIREVAVSKR